MLSVSACTHFLIFAVFALCSQFLNATVVLLLCRVTTHAACVPEEVIATKCHCKMALKLFLMPKKAIHLLAYAILINATTQMKAKP